MVKGKINCIAMHCIALLIEPVELSKTHFSDRLGSRQFLPWRKLEKFHESDKAGLQQIVPRIATSTSKSSMPTNEFPTTLPGCLQIIKETL